MQLNVCDGHATWWSRNGNDLTERLPKPTADVAELEDCILDGELCALGPDGQPDFSLLKGSMNARGSGKLVYFAFDIMWRGETDLKPYALATRKTFLAHVIEAGGRPWPSAYASSSISKACQHSS